MVLFEREDDERVPIKYEKGTKVMGFNRCMSNGKLICGEIIDVEQGTSFLDENQYKVEGEYSGWINESEIILFNSEIWEAAKRTWEEYLKLKKETYEKYLEFCNSWYKG